jgi:hypothetical protein
MIVNDHIHNTLAVNLDLRGVGRRRQHCSRHGLWYIGHVLHAHRRIALGMAADCGPVAGSQPKRHVVHVPDSRRVVSNPEVNRHQRTKNKSP